MNYTFTEEDRSILKGVKSVMKGIAFIYGNNCEVVLHSMESADRPIIAIENNHVSGRDVGEPMSDFVFKLLEDMSKADEPFINFFKNTTLSKNELKSSTTLIRNSQNIIIGALCINMDLSIPVQEFFKDFLQADSDKYTGTKTAAYTQSTRELIDSSITMALEEVNNQRGLSSTERNKAVVYELYKKGIFSVKKGVEITAEELGISRFTVYNYLKAIKDSGKK
ncbi:PAS domain-containing protein [Spirochaeta isovalerica]|uniref:Putative transcriptional regulator YheO n=1 Tax=Spirochaeta isovalerica TaxID=150 RepID=A0A841R630_9SPIO|nr:putative transcriptional regulator YheO [Spirochaeta isovalerica]